MNVTERLEALSHIGLQPDGSVTRISGSAEYQSACDLIMSWMRADGMNAFIDPYGNVIGVLPGTDPTLKPIVMGSHIDTVVGGGKYDGVLGVLGGMEVARRGPYRHTLNVCVFFDEEVTMSGSIGYLATMKEGDLKAFLELHVEQGPVLDSRKKRIGIVTGIVGQRRTQVVFKGTANHAGTTPMDMRDDALVKASEFTLFVNRTAKEYGGLVATVGQLSVSPNKFSVVPGRVDCTLQVRDLSIDNILKFLMTCKHEFPEAEFTVSYSSEPALCDLGLVELATESTEKLGYSYEIMPSRASHDAQNFPRVCPSVMIFVPSVDGVSHSGLEYTSPEDCIAGVEVLHETVMRIDSEQ